MVCGGGNVKKLSYAEESAWYILFGDDALGGEGDDAGLQIGLKRVSSAGRGAEGISTGFAKIDPYGDCTTTKNI